MSYSFRVVGSDKADAVVKVKAELDKVVEIQPIHAGDRPSAEAAVEAFVALVKDDATQSIQVMVSGSCWRVGEGGFNNVSVNVEVSLVAKD